MPKYRLDRVILGTAISRQSAWAFARVPTRGIEYSYPVIDANYHSRNRWEFAVRVPTDPYERIEVRPTKVPNDKALAGLERRALMFMRATRPGYTQYRYCQLSLARTRGAGTRDVVHRDEKRNLPYWLRRLGWRLKQKATVRNTAGTDGHSLVVLVQPHDHAMMIRLFMASKAWVLKRGVSLDD
jgi:hypothetical protein